MSLETQLERAQQQLADCAVKINNQRAEIRRLEACREEVNLEFQALLDRYNELRRETGTDELVSHEQAVQAIRARAKELLDHVAEYDALFDLQHARLSEADKLYVEAHPRPEYPHGYRPDLAALVDWLLGFHAYVQKLPCDCWFNCGGSRPQACERCRLLGRTRATYRTTEGNRLLCLQDHLTMLQCCQAVHDYLVATQGCSEPPEAIYRSDPNGGLVVLWELFWAAKQHFTGLVPRASGRVVGEIVWEAPEDAPAIPPPSAVT